MRKAMLAPGARIAGGRELRISIFALLALALLAAALPSFAAEEIVFWHGWGGDEGKALERIVEGFNKSQDRIVVRPVFVPIGMGEKIMATLAGGSTPEVVTVWDWMVVPLGYNGAIIPLEDRLSKAGITEGDYVKGVWSYGSYKGHKYGLPTTLNIYAFMWNKNLYRDAGFDPDKPPATTQDLDRYAERLTESDSKDRLKRLGFLPSVSHIYFYVFGGSLVDSVTGAITANNPKNVEALDWIATYYKKYDIEKIRRFQAGWGDSMSPLNPFFRGQLAMQEAGQWEILSAQKFAKPDFRYGVSAFPAPAGGRKDVAYVSGSFWVIPAGSKKKDQAFEFLAWLTAPAQAAEFAASLFNIPPRISALESPVFESKLTPEFRQYLKLLQSGFVYTFPQLPIGQFYLTELTQALSDVQSGAKTAKQALDSVQEKVEREMQRYK